MAGKNGVQQPLRGELSVTLVVGAGEDLKFEMERVDVELQGVVGRADEMRKDVKFWLVSADAGTKDEERHPHALKLRPLSRRVAMGEESLTTADESDEPEPRCTRGVNGGCTATPGGA